jgi:hypothetical protein
VALGQTIDDSWQITNTSGHRWAATYAAVIDEGGFRIDSASMDHAPSAYLGTTENTPLPGGEYKLGPLGTGNLNTGDLRIRMTADERIPMGDLVSILVWGASTRRGRASYLNIPTRAPNLGCEHVVR